MAELKVLFATSEVAPLIKTGGLADVAGVLPIELLKLGHRVTLILPSYPQLRAARGSAEKVAQFQT